MDTLSPIYLALSILIVIIAIVCFWFISKKAPKGVLLAVSVFLWILGKTMGSQQVRELMVLGGAVQMSGSIGVIFGLIDLFRKKKNST